jgi:PAS domain-containing protein
VTGSRTDEDDAGRTPQVPDVREPFPVEARDGDGEDACSAHLVQFYEGPRELADRVTRYLAAGVEAGGTAVVIAEARQRDSIRAGLADRGVDVQALERADRYVALDAEETLARLLVGGVPDEARFERVVGGVIEAASRGGTVPVRAFGEMVALLWARGEHRAALRLERLWNRLRESREFSLLCAYPKHGFDGEADGRGFLDVCAEHDGVIGAARTKPVPRARRPRAVHDLERRTREVREILDAMDDAVVELDAGNTLLYANPAFFARTGLSPRACGRAFLAHLEDPAPVEELWPALLRGGARTGAPPEVVIRRPVPDGGEGVRLQVHRALLQIEASRLFVRLFLRDAN